MQVNKKCFDWLSERKQPQQMKREKNCFSNNICPDIFCLISRSIIKKITKLMQILIKKVIVLVLKLFFLFFFFFFNCQKEFLDTEKEKKNSEVPQICTQGLSGGVVVLSGGEDEKKIDIYILNSRDHLFISILLSNMQAVISY